MTYQSSSQALKFTFTHESLNRHRTNAYELAAASFSVSLSQDDHMRYVAYYCDKLLESSDKIKFNHFQKFTALALMQRVYIDRTIWEIPPPLAMISCLFLVKKFIRPETLSNLLADLGFGQDFYDKFQPESQMAKIEIGVLTALDFKLKIYLPFHQLVALCNGQPFYKQYNEMQSKLFSILRTDALLLYPPTQIALAAAASVIGEEEAIKALYMVEGMNKVQAPENLDLHANIQDILSLTRDAMPENEVREIEQKLGQEIAVFHVIETEKQETFKNNKPTSMLPP